MTTSELTNTINKMNYSFDFIDDRKEYSFYKNLNYCINKAIPTLTPEQAREVYNSLTEFHQGQEFGQMLLAMLPQPEPTPLTAKQTFRSKIFIQAWEMFKCSLFTSFASALKAAWVRFKVVAEMKSGVVTFQYIKTDGSVRTASGTLTGFDYIPKTTESKPKSEIIKYFDLEAQSFRSFRIDRFLGLVA